jgi:hypothetical protein
MSIDTLLTELAIDGEADHPCPERLPSIVEGLLAPPDTELCRAVGALRSESYAGILMAMAANAESDGADGMARALRLMGQRLAAYEATQL